MSYKVPSRSRVKTDHFHMQLINFHVRFYQLPWRIFTLPLQALIKPKRQVYPKQLYCHFLSLIDKWIYVMTTVANYKMSIRRNTTILNKVSNTDKFWRKLYTVPIAILELQHGKLDTFCDPVVAKIKDKIMNFSTIVLFLDTLEIKGGHRDILCIKSRNYHKHPKTHPPLLFAHFLRQKWEAFARIFNYSCAPQPVVCDITCD